MSFLQGILNNMQKEAARPLSAEQKALQQREAEKRKKIQQFREKVTNQLQGFMAQKGSNPLRYPETNLPVELRQIIFEEASNLKLTTDEFGKPGVDRFIMVFKKQPTTAELKSLHTKFDAPDNDEVAGGFGGSEDAPGGNGGDEGGNDDAQPNDEPPEEDNYEDVEDEEYPYEEHVDEDGYEYGDYETGSSRPAHSAATKSSQKVATRIPRLASEKRESNRARAAAEDDDDTFELKRHGGGPKLSGSIKQEIDRKVLHHEEFAPDLPSASIKRKRNELDAGEDHLSKKVKTETD